MTAADGAGDAHAWAPYLDAFHAEHAGITERILAAAVAEDGETPYGWLRAAAPPPTAGSTVLDLACGSAPL